MTDRIFTLSVRSTWSGGGLRKKVVATPKAKPDFSGRLIVLVHGYANNQGVARDSYAKFLSNFSDTFRKGVRGHSGFPDIAHFYWPGDSSGFFDAVINQGGYARALENAKQAATLLAEYLATTHNKPKNLTFIGHSMGCRLILEMLREQMPGFPHVQSVALLAAAVGSKMFASGHGLEEIGKTFAGRSYVLYSSDDQVLKWAFPAGQGHAKIKGGESYYYRKAIGHYGPPREFKATKSKMEGYGHSDYWGSPEITDKVTGFMFKAKEHNVVKRVAEKNERYLNTRNLQFRKPSPDHPK